MGSRTECKTGIGEEHASVAFVLDFNGIVSITLYNRT